MKIKSSVVDLTGLFTALFCLVSLYLFPGIAKSSTVRAIVLCGKSVIPSLFPFIVLTRIFLHFFTKLRTMQGAMLKKRKMSTAGYTAFFAGLLSGFPTGALLAGQMYSQGIISKNEAESVALFSSAASPAFCINLFGGEIVNSRVLGLCVYIAAVTVNVVLLCVHNVVSHKEGESVYTVSFIKGTKAPSITEIIYDSCMTVINICAYVTFFMCAGEVLYTTVSFFLPTNEILKAYFIGTAEMTSGVEALNVLPFSKKVLCGASIIGFGGISAMMQTASVCEKYGLDCRRLFFTKLICTFAVPLVTFIIVLIGSTFFGATDSSFPFTVILGLITVTIFAFLVYFIRKTLKIFNKSKVNL